MFHGALTTVRTCPAVRAKAGHVPRCAHNRQDMPLATGKEWTYWPYVHSSGPREGMSSGGVDGLLPAGVPWVLPGLDMSLRALRTRRTCPVVQAKDGHAGVMSIPEGRGWACSSVCSEPAGRAPCCRPRMDMLVLCPFQRARAGHVPWRPATTGDPRTSLHPGPPSNAGPHSTPPFTPGFGAPGPSAVR
jgi:hypothetical protein